MCTKREILPSENENWYKIYKLIHEYLFLALADAELCETSLMLLNKFYSVPNYQEAMCTVTISRIARNRGNSWRTP